MQRTLVLELKLIQFKFCSLLSPGARGRFRTPCHWISGREPTPSPLPLAMTVKFQKNHFFKKEAARGGGWKICQVSH
jgi:hypothetical protein